MLKFKEYLRELTISPDYQQKGQFNPFYTVTPEIEKSVKKEVKPKKELKFKIIRHKDNKFKKYAFTKKIFKYFKKN